MTELVVCEQWQGTVKGHWCHKIRISLFLGPLGGTTGARGTQDSASDLEKLPQFMKQAVSNYYHSLKQAARHCFV